MNITTKPALSLIKELPAVSGSINKVAISPNGNWIASAGSYSSYHKNDSWFLQLYNSSFEKVHLENNQIHGKEIKSVCFGLDGRQLIVGSSPVYQKPSFIVCWNVENLCAEYFVELDDRIGTITTSTNDKVFFVVDSSRMLKEYSIGTGNLIKQQIIDKDSRMWYLPLVISSDDRYIYGAVHVGSIRSLCTASCEDTRINFQASNEFFESLFLSPDNQILVGGSDQRMRTWNAQTGKLLHSFYAHAAGVRCLAVTPDSRFLISAGDEKIKFWDLITANKLSTIIAHDSPIRSIALSRDGRTLVSGATDGIVKVWQVNEISEIIGE